MHGVEKGGSGVGNGGQRTRMAPLAGEVGKHGSSRDMRFFHAGLQRRWYGEWAFVGFLSRDVCLCRGDCIFWVVVLNLAIKAGVLGFRLPGLLL